MVKINWKKILVIGYWILVISLLVYSRFVNLGWGLPYPMHPDERNMTVAVQSFDCHIPITNNQFPNNFQFSIFNFPNCLNPHFFAYGQFPLYLGYILMMVYQLATKTFGQLITFNQAVMSLRIISAIASVINAIIIIKIINVITNKKSLFLTIISYLIVIFSPYFIQFSHFGTTESLLMLFYSLTLYLSLLFINNKINNVYYIIFTALVAGSSMATKVSSVIFLVVPIYAVILKDLKFKTIFNLARLIILSLIFFVVFSPYNFIELGDFLGALRYESDVALGSYVVFYTRQFVNTIPVLFQFEKIFPYVLGWPQFILFILGFFGLSWKNKEINLLRFAFLIYFLSNAFMFAKWTRFMTPIFPLTTIFALLFLEKIKVINVIKIITVIIMILPGIAYLSIYQNSDIRFTASDWIYKNMSENSKILSETANVVDLPVQSQKSKVESRSYQYASFNFYDLDENKDVQSNLQRLLPEADYIFIPSRRIFKNHFCNNNSQSLISNFQTTFNFPITNFINNCEYLKNKYPSLNEYYKKLFNGELGFVKVTEFDSFPKLCLPFNIGCLKFNDESAEETWTVFDHPVVRIYKKLNVQPRTRTSSVRGRL